MTHHTDLLKIFAVLCVGALILVGLVAGEARQRAIDLDRQEIDAHANS